MKQRLNQVVARELLEVLKLAKEEGMFDNILQGAEIMEIPGSSAMRLKLSKSSPGGMVPEVGITFAEIKVSLSW